MTWLPFPRCSQRSILSSTGRSRWPSRSKGLYIGAGAGGNYLQQERVLASPGLGLRRQAHGDTNIGGVGRWQRRLRFRQRAAARGRGRLPAQPRAADQRLHGQRRADRSPAATNTAYGGRWSMRCSTWISAINWIYPYFGLGGWHRRYRACRMPCTRPTRPFRAGSRFKAPTDRSDNFAYQGIFGLSFPLAAVPGLSLTTEYRFYGVLDAPGFHGAAQQRGGSVRPIRCGRGRIAEATST